MIKKEGGCKEILKKEGCMKQKDKRLKTKVVDNV